MKLLLLCLLASGADALQLFAARAPAPVAMRPACRMQIPAEDTGTATDMVVEAGKVVPTSTPVVAAEAHSAASEALKDKLLAANPDLAIGFRRAEFWSNQTTTLLEVINVLGRFESCAEWRERSVFSVVENTRVEDEAQGETRERHDMAVRMKCSERVALYQNCPNLPFTNAKLAASVGLTVEDFAGLEVTKASCNVVYDALAESRSGLIPYATMDARRAGLTDTAGGFNEVAFRTGLYKSRGLIILAWFLFGKGNFVWVLVAAKLLHDWRPDVIPSPVDMGLFKIGTFI
jgi:hypothetical protein